MIMNLLQIILIFDFNNMKYHLHDFNHYKNVSYFNQKIRNFPMVLKSIRNLKFDQ